MTALALSVFAAGAAWTDIRNNKIYNRYLLPGLFAGLFLRFFSQGTRGAFFALLSVTVTFLVLIPVYALKGLAGGDVKLLTALASFFTVKESLVLIGVSFVLTALYGVIRVIGLRRLKGRVHFAVPVFIGVVLLLAGGIA